MSGTTKPVSSSPKAADPVVFEEALKKLESIVDKMETGDLPLDKMLAQYEEGVRLGQICQQKLAEAELRIETLEKNSAGELVLKPSSHLSPEDE
ncbi:MAG: exodeoxyribonuclease VII small subunit [Verrucomicrobiales bacterium]|nr:exodeoxyribonuclease VII small subunit [Verrucomicrobiales bacterium]